jgi:hypothetical protein
MNWNWWPFGKRAARRDAEASQEGALRVQAEVIIPLRTLRTQIDTMRMQDNLPGAVARDMHKGREERGENGDADRR